MSAPERSLWRAVLSQAFDDAEMAPNGDEDGSETFDASQARQYLCANNFQEAEHLKLVCEYAEIPADRVISWARQRYLVEHTVGKRVDCGSAAAAFPTTEAIAAPEKRELCSRTTQNADPRRAVMSAPHPCLFFS